MLAWVRTGLLASMGKTGLLASMGKTGFTC